MIEIDEQFYKYPKLLLQADGYVSNGKNTRGEFVKLTDADKNVYVVMKARNEFFEKHYDKQSDVAEICNLTLKKTGDALRDFILHGVIDAEKGHSGTHKNWRYKKVHCLDLLKRVVSEDKEVTYQSIGSLSESIWKKVEKRKVSIPQQSYQPVPDWNIYDNQEPF